MTPVYSGPAFGYDAGDMDTMKRRAFIQGALKTAAVASAGGAGLLLQGCSTGKDLDLLIAGGMVYDGTGGPPVRADVGISGGAIRLVGRIRRSRAAAVIEAGGLAVSPGFIDVHDHTDTGLLVNPKAESAVRQGVTTLVSGQCGGSPFPLTEEEAEDMRRRFAEEYGLEADWRDIRGFLARLEQSGSAVNYSTFVGHGTVRAAAMGYGDRAATPEELEKMKALVAEAMAGGALGLSSGLEYTPGSFASTEELIELSRVAAAAGGVYATHMRDEEDNVLEAVTEALRIAREAPIRLQISHLKIGIPPKLAEDRRAHGHAREGQGGRPRFSLRPLSLHRRRDEPVHALSRLGERGRDAGFVARLKDPALDARIRAHSPRRRRATARGTGSSSPKWARTRTGRSRG